MEGGASSTADFVPQRINLSGRILRLDTPSRDVVQAYMRDIEDIMQGKIYKRIHPTIQIVGFLLLNLIILRYMKISTEG